MATKAKKNEQATEFERMLMWTSYRYCIGRHTYVVTMADEMAEHYYSRLCDEDKLFAATDIRSEIMEYLRLVLPFHFDINVYAKERELNPLKTLMRFFEREGVKSEKELYNYSYVCYDAREYEFDVEKCKPNERRSFSIYDIEDLIPWERLASCFDVSRHCLVTAKDGQQVRAFISWERNVIPAEEKGFYRNADFGWHEVLVPLDEYIKGNAHRRINEDLVTGIDYEYYNKN